MKPMNKKEELEARQKSLTDRLKTEPAKVPMQKVLPIDEQETVTPKQEEEQVKDKISWKDDRTQISAFIPTILYDQVRERVFKEKKKLTTILIESLEEYVNKNK